MTYCSVRYCTSFKINLPKPTIKCLFPCQNLTWHEIVQQTGYYAHICTFWPKKVLNVQYDNVCNWKPDIFPYLNYWNVLEIFVKKNFFNQSHWGRVFHASFPHNNVSQCFIFFVRKSLRTYLISYIIEHTLYRTYLISLKV